MLVRFVSWLVWEDVTRGVGLVNASILRLGAQDGDRCWTVFDENTIGLVTCEENNSTVFSEVAGGYIEHSEGARLESMSIPGMCLARKTGRSILQLPRKSVMLGGYMIQNYRYSAHDNSAVSDSWCLTECIYESCGGSILHGNVMLLNTCHQRAALWINRGEHLINAESGHCLQLCRTSPLGCKAGDLGGVNLISTNCTDASDAKWSRMRSPYHDEGFLNMTIGVPSRTNQCLDTCLADSESGLNCNNVGQTKTSAMLRSGIIGKNVFAQKCGSYFAGHNQAWRIVPVSSSDGLRLVPCEDPLADQWAMRSSKMMLVGGELDLAQLCIKIVEESDLKLVDCEGIHSGMVWNVDWLSDEELKTTETLDRAPTSPTKEPETAESPVMEPEVVAKNLVIEPDVVAEIPKTEPQVAPLLSTEPILETAPSPAVPEKSEKSDILPIHVPGESTDSGALSGNQISNEASQSEPNTNDSDDDAVLAGNNLAQSTLGGAGESASKGKGSAGGSGTGSLISVVLGVGGVALAVLISTLVTCRCYFARRFKEKNPKKSSPIPEINIQVDNLPNNHVSKPSMDQEASRVLIPLSKNLPDHNFSAYKPPLPRNSDSINVSPVAGQKVHLSIDEPDLHENNESFQTEEVQPILEAIDPLTEGTVFAEKYLMESRRVIGKSTVVCYATHKFSKDLVVIKFFASEINFHNSKEIHSLLSPQQFCRLEDVIPKHEAFPSALVFQRGDYTLSSWLSRSRPNSLSKKLALSQILEGLVELHRQHIVHRDLKPTNIMWFSSDHTWKILDLDDTAQSGEFAPFAYTLLYASPEALKGHGKRVALETLADMWSFGIIAFEVLTGMRYYGPRVTTRKDVLEMMRSEETLPSLQCIEEPQARRLVANLTCLDSRQRWTAAVALQNAFFRSAEDTMQQQDRWTKVTDTLSKIVNLVEITAEELQASNIMVSITVEYFNKKKSDPTEPFWSRDGTEVCSIADDNIPDQPIYLLNIGSPYRLRVVLSHDHKSILPVDTIHQIKLTPPDANGIHLEFEPIASSDAFEFVALWDPTKHISRSLSRTGTAFGAVQDKYVAMGIEIVYGVRGQPDTKHAIQGKIFCRMYPAESKFRMQRFKRVFHKAWEEAPQWIRDGARGTLILTTLAVNVITV